MGVREREGIGCSAIAAPPYGWRRAIAAWLGLLALLFNLGAGPLLPDIAFPRAGTIATISVCTIDGMVAVDVGGGAATDAEGDRHTVICALCLPLGHGAVDPTSLRVAVPAISAELLAVVRPPLVRRADGFLANRVPGARAPPFA
ncbi:MAG: DUF2946 family protein [Bacteroidota bacterium]